MVGYRQSYRCEYGATPLQDHPLRYAVTHRKTFQRSRGVVPSSRSWAAEIRARAKRRVGEISADLDKLSQEESGAMSRGLPSHGKTSKIEALAAAGVSKSEAHRCELIASIPTEKVEHIFAQCFRLPRPPSTKVPPRELWSDNNASKALTWLPRCNQVAPDLNGICD